MPIYEIDIEIPEDQRPDSAGDRIKMLLTILLKTVAGERHWRVLEPPSGSGIDFEKCRCSIELHTTSFKGLAGGRAIIDVRLISEGPGKQSSQISPST